MSRSYLLIDPEQSLNLTPGPDHLTISLPEKKSNISIDQIRELKEWISLKPFYQKEKVAFIADAGKMTAEAQNSLLKILEEPPQGSFLILDTKNKKNLLPTVVSRCQIVLGPRRLLELPEIGKNFTIIDKQFQGSASENEQVLIIDNSSSTPDQFTQFDQVLQSPLVEKFWRAEKLSKLERTEILTIVDDWTKKARGELIKSRQLQNAKTLKELYFLRQRIAKNVGMRLALENFFMQIKT